DLLGDLLVRRDRREGQREGRAPEAVQVLPQAEYPPVVEPEYLPDGIAALYRGVEGAHPRGVAVEELSADVDDDVAVLLVPGLEHDAASVIGSSSRAEPLRVERLVVLLASCVHALELRGEPLVPRLVGPEARGLLHRGVPVLRPHS